MDILFQLDQSPGAWIYRAHTRALAALRKAFVRSGHDLTMEQWAVMARIRNDKGLSQRQLGERTFKDRHNINRIINILEKRGYTERRPDENDRRAYRLFLTKAGSDVLKKTNPIVAEHFRKRFEGISAGDLDTLRRVLEQVIRNVEKLDAAQDSVAGTVAKRRKPARSLDEGS